MNDELKYIEITPDDSIAKDITVSYKGKPIEARVVKLTLVTHKNLNEESDKIIQEMIENDSR